MLSIVKRSVATDHDKALRFSLIVWPPLNTLPDSYVLDVSASEELAEQS